MTWFYHFSIFNLWPLQLQEFVLIIFCNYWPHVICKHVAFTCKIPWTSLFSHAHLPSTLYQRVWQLAVYVTVDMNLDFHYTCFYIFLELVFSCIIWPNAHLKISGAFHNIMPDLVTRLIDDMLFCCFFSFLTNRINLFMFDNRSWRNEESTRRNEKPRSSIPSKYVARSCKEQ